MEWSLYYMKKITLFLFVLSLVIFTGCNRYNYSNWKNYGLQIYADFMYPDDWKKAFTNDGLLFLYENSSTDEKNIMIFQSKSHANQELGVEGETESNAYSNCFKRVNILSSEYNALNSTFFNTETVSVNNEYKVMESVIFIEGDYPPKNSFKIYFTENITEETKNQLKESISHIEINNIFSLHD